MIENLAEDVHAFTSNVFLVTGDRTVLVDAGANFDVVSEIEAHVDDIDAVVLTHTHKDHVANLEAVKDAFDVEAWGFDTSVEGVDNEIADEETVVLGDHEYVAMHTPGHKDDHLCLYAREPGVLFAGDLIFEHGSYGRTDLPEGDHQELVLSIHDVLDMIEKDLQVMYAGHGQRVATNPYGSVDLSAQEALNDAEDPPQS
ncbi:MBL fold metallo-hydrolase [Halostagnicola kamekurae]|uniref:Glyoxylase, beta-lactamase superfamily II n=1 Tax=Halostagnicola kamekurae TaxID=619731 RepID=A0A1I6QQV4_9EURY|nr:MBL fold metallo-hydrolase [Halostagnicola kamekurae]SFS54856.1 Glyoxylase, beta-lactamase superfamily II [Halostagnicola kamekurae]